MNEQILALLQNEDAVKKLAEVKTPEESYAVAQSFGLCLSFDEYAAEMKIIKEKMLEQMEGILSEDDLQRMAGGVDGENVLQTVLVGLSLVTGGGALITGAGIGITMLIAAAVIVA